MHYLKIVDGKGEFSKDGVSFHPIDEIAKEDILELVDKALDPGDDFIMDEFVAESFTNPARKVIYSNLYTKFSDLVTNKPQFVDEVNEIYKDSFEKYKLESQASEAE